MSIHYYGKIVNTMHQLIFEQALSPLEGIRTNSFKFIKAPESELFDVTKDKTELKNLYAADTQTGKKMLNKMNKVKSEIPIPLKPKLLALDKESIEILQSLGYLSTQISAVLPKVKLEDPKNHSAVFDKFKNAQDAMAKQKYKEAVELLQAIRKELPGCHLANFMLGVGEMALGNYVEALRLFTNEKEYLKETALLNIGHVYLRMHELEKARTAYKEAITLNPDLLDAFLYSTEIALMQNQIDEAELLLQKADLLKMNDPKLRFLQGSIMLIKKNYSAAENYFKQTIALNSNYGMAYASLGQLSLLRLDSASALKYYQRAYLLMPNNRDVILSLAFLYLKQGTTGFPEAYKLYRKALELNPEAPDANEIRQVLKQLEMKGVPR